MTRSVRDTARWFDVCNGHHAADPLSLPRVDGWENALGTVNVAGLRVAIVHDWDGAVLSPAMWNVLLEAADHLVASAGLRRIDGVNTELPRMGAAWSISGMIEIRASLGDMWPACADDLTPEMRAGLQLTEGRYSEAERTKIEARRAAVNLRMSQIFEEVDLVITATNPDIAFTAEGPLPKVFGGVKAGGRNNGLLTFPCNLHGNPGISVPAGFVDGLPVGLQIIGPHFSEQILLELALRLERERPWPLVATGAPI
jgi:aspartyl-tRNA(Asn)/glutamyl-tRNA(Gln) amidotransferase subunit A